MEQEKIDKITNWMIQITNEWAEKNGYNVETPKLSKKAQKIQDFIRKEDFGCRKDNVAGLVSLIIEENISVYEKSLPYSAKTGVVLVPIKTPNSHDYTIDQPTILHEEGYAFPYAFPADINGKELDIGLKIPLIKDSIRPATEDEIKDLVTRLLSKEKEGQSALEWFLDLSKIILV
jgi:hypothetical protein